jgi:hypothetical protein
VYRSINREIVSEEVTLLWLSRGDLKGEPESEIVAAHDIMQQKYCKEKQIANPDYVKSLMRQ